MRARNGVMFVLSDVRGMDFLDALLDHLCADGFGIAGMTAHDVAMANARRAVADEIRADLRTIDPEGLARFEVRRIKAFADKMALAREENAAQRGHADDLRGFGKGAA